MESLRHRVVSTTAVLALVAGSALADHNTPYKARTATTHLVTAYEPCVSSTVSTDAPGLILAACPATRGDPTCGFGPSGWGKVTAKVMINPFTKDGTDILLTASMRGLEPGCEGHELTVVASAITTLDDCGGAACTIETGLNTDFAAGSCIVRDGRCGIGPISINQFAGTMILEPARGVNVQVKEVTVKRGSLRTFAVGLFLPSGRSS